MIILFFRIPVSTVRVYLSRCCEDDASSMEEKKFASGLTGKLLR